MPIKICVIDDYSVNNFITSKMLEKYGPDSHVIQFEGAVNAVEYLKNCQLNNNYPEVIFLDIFMPIMDGWRFLDALDTFSIDLDHTIKIYCLSTTLHPREHAQALAHKRISGFYSKPLTAENIKIIFNGIIANESKA